MYEKIIEQLVELNIKHIKCHTIEDSYEYDTILPSNNSRFIKICNNQVEVKYTHPEIKQNDRFNCFITFLKNINLDSICVSFVIDTGDFIGYCKMDPNNKVFKSPIKVPILCFCTSQRVHYNDNIILVPLYCIDTQVIKNNIKLTTTHDCELVHKNNTMIFCGANSSKHRVDFALWSTKTNALMDESESAPTCTRSIVLLNPVYKNTSSLIPHNNISSCHTSLCEQLKSKILVSINGFGTTNGLYWKMYSNSLVCMLVGNMYEYWYSLLVHEKNILQFSNYDDMNTYINTLDINDANDAKCREMITHKQNLAKMITDVSFNSEYMRNLLLELTKLQTHIN